jgi:hypothetical protein
LFVYCYDKKSQIRGPFYEISPVSIGWNLMKAPVYEKFTFIYLCLFFCGFGNGPNCK